MSEKRKDAERKLTELNTFLATLDPAIRERAFDVILPYYFDQDFQQISKKIDSNDPAKQDNTMAKFFHGLESKQPSDNVLAIVAWLYFEHGKIPVTRSWIEKLASEIGLTIPERVDMTLKSAKAKGKSLFNKSGRGKYTLTVHGESHLQSTYGVTKGNKPLPEASEEN